MHIAKVPNCKTFKRSQFHTVTVSHCNNSTLSQLHTVTVAHCHSSTLSQVKSATLSQFQTFTVPYTYTLHHIPYSNSSTISQHSQLQPVTIAHSQSSTLLQIHTVTVPHSPSDSCPVAKPSLPDKGVTFVRCLQGCYTLMFAELLVTQGNSHPLNLGTNQLTEMLE